MQLSVLSQLEIEEMEEMKKWPDFPFQLRKQDHFLTSS